MILSDSSSFANAEKDTFDRESIQLPVCLGLMAMRRVYIVFEGLFSGHSNGWRDTVSSLSIFPTGSVLGA